jgi:hypothetical protein
VGAHQSPLQPIACATIHDSILLGREQPPPRDEALMIAVDQRMSVGLQPARRVLQR